MNAIAPLSTVDITKTAEDALENLIESVGGGGSNDHEVAIEAVAPGLMGAEYQAVLELLRDLEHDVIYDQMRGVCGPRSNPFQLQAPGRPGVASGTAGLYRIEAPGLPS